MSVSSMLVGFVRLIWATGSGADVMKRIAAPMVGGLITSAFLTLEIIPVISTYWRQEQLLWEQLAPLDPTRLSRLKLATATLAAGWTLLVVTLVSTIYVAISSAVLTVAVIVAGLLIVGGTGAY